METAQPIMGRPLKFKNAQILQEKIDAYFNHCDETKKPYTVTGLAIFLDCDRDTLLNYQKKEDFFGTISRAKLRIEAAAEEALFLLRNVNGVIFNLKNNFGWRDKHEIQSSGSVTMAISRDDAGFCGIPTKQ